MDDKLKALQEEMDKVISEDEYFTEQDKREIRKRIIEMNQSVPAQKRRNLLPQLLTAISLCAFFVFLSGIIGKELGFFASDTPQDANSPVIVPADEEDPTSIEDRYGKREPRIEREIEKVLAREDLFKSKLKGTLKGAYMDESGNVAVDFEHFGEIIGAQPHIEKGYLMATLDIAVYKSSSVNQVYYLFDGDQAAFTAWQESDDDGGEGEFQQYMSRMQWILSITFLMQAALLFIFKNQKDLLWVIFSFILMVFIHHLLFTQNEYMSEHLPRQAKWFIVLLVVGYVAFLYNLYSWIKVMKKNKESV